MAAASLACPPTANTARSSVLLTDLDMRESKAQVYIGGQAMLGDKYPQCVHNKAMLYCDYDKKAVAERILQKMEQSGVTATDIADACNVSKQAVGQWFKTGSIGAERFPAIASVLGVTIDELMIGPESMDRASKLARNLAGKATPRSKKILNDIEQAAQEGRLTESDLVLLNELAQRFQN